RSRITRSSWTTTIRWTRTSRTCSGSRLSDRTGGVPVVAGAAGRGRDSNLSPPPQACGRVSWVRQWLGPLRKGGLAPTGAGRLVELAAQALVLGLQVVEASLKGLAAGTGDGLHTSL